MNDLNEYILRALLFILLFFGCQSQNDTTHPLILDLKHANEIAVFENHYDTYFEWLRRNQQSRIAIHFDTHIDLNWIRDKDLNALISTKDWRLAKKMAMHPTETYLPERKILHVGNWFYPAFKANMIRELIWVVPDSALNGDDWLNKFKLGLRLNQKNITAAEIESFHFEGLIIKGVLYGLPITICAIEEIPGIEEFVLLDFDMDFFDFNSAIYLDRLSVPRIWPENVIKVLQAKRIRTDQVTISFSVENGYTSLSYKWLGEELFLRLSKNRKKNIKGFELMQEGFINRDRSNLERAISKFEKASQLLPKNPAPVFGLSLIYGELGKKDLAENYLQQAYKLDKKYGAALLYLADNYFYDQKYKDAASTYKQIRRASPQVAQHIQRHYAQCQQNLGNFPEAIKAYKRVLKWQPNQPEVIENLGDCLFEEGKETEFLNYYKSGLQIDSNSPTLHGKLGKYELRMGNHQAAMENFKSALQVMPNYTESQFYLAAVLKKLGQHEKVKVALKRGEEIDPGWATKKGNMGVMLLRLGRTEKSQEIFEMINLLYPEDEVARQNLKIVTAQKNNP